MHDTARTTGSETATTNADINVGGMYATLREAGYSRQESEDAICRFLARMKAERAEDKALAAFNRAYDPAEEAVNRAWNRAYDKRIAAGRPE